MLIRRKRLFWFGVALLAAGFACLLLPPFGEYCESNYANKYDCAIYEVTVALAAFVDAHNGSFIALATIVVAWFTWTLRQSSEKMWKTTSKSVDLAQQEFETTLRARVSLTKCQITRGVIVGDKTKIRFAFRLENTGQLPATECSLTYTTSAFVEKGFRPPKDDELLGQERQVHIVIASKEVCEKHNDGLNDFPPSTYEQAIDTERLDRERKDRSIGRNAYLWAGITFVYMDGFDKERVSWKFFEWGDGDFRECASRQD